MGSEYFLSYNHLDHKLAAKVRQRLWGDAFLAHEDIEVSAEWRLRILEELETCSALIAIVTKHFALSPWANQEVGIAIANGKPVGSLVFRQAKIPGFLESLQGVHAKENRIGEAVDALMNRMAELRHKILPANESYTEMAEILSDVVIKLETVRIHATRQGTFSGQEKFIQSGLEDGRKLWSLLVRSERVLNNRVVKMANVLCQRIQEMSSRHPDQFEQYREATLTALNVAHILLDDVRQNYLQRGYLKIVREEALGTD